MKTLKFTLAILFVSCFSTLKAQTNVFDDVIASSPNHTLLEAALIQEGLDTVLQEIPAVTVFAPTDVAITNLTVALGITIPDLLALPNLTDILLYHVIPSTVPSSAVTNGAIVNPVSTTNTLKLTRTSTNMIYVNQAQVTGADLTAMNGVVHSINAVVLPSQTVVDIAISAGLTSLTAAVVRAELLPALSNPLATFTVFAPTNAAFSDLATALGTDLNGVLANPQLANILLYHVHNNDLLSTALTNGPLSTLYGESVNVTVGGTVTINTATVVIADSISDNGVVHVIDRVLVPLTLNTENEVETSFNIFPNPTTDYLSIEFIQNTFNEVSILDMNGKVLIKKNLNNDGIENINTTSLTKGTYILELRGENNISRKKFIVL